MSKPTCFSTEPAGRVTSARCPPPGLGKLKAELGPTGTVGLRGAQRGTTALLPAQESLEEAPGQPQPYVPEQSAPLPASVSTGNSIRCGCAGERRGIKALLRHSLDFCTILSLRKRHVPLLFSASTDSWLFVHHLCCPCISISWLLAQRDALWHQIWTTSASTSLIPLKENILSKWNHCLKCLQIVFLTYLQTTNQNSIYFKLLLISSYMIRLSSSPLLKPIKQKTYSTYFNIHIF